MKIKLYEPKNTPYKAKNAVKRDIFIGFSSEIAYSVNDNEICPVDSNKKSYLGSSFCGRGLNFLDCHRRMMKVNIGYREKQGKLPPVHRLESSVIQVGNTLFCRLGEFFFIKSQNIFRSLPKGRFAACHICIDIIFFGLHEL